MEAAISLQDVANVVTFVAPGYFAIQTYALVYAKRDRDFSRLVVESVVYSLPIVALCNVIWETLLRQGPVTSLRLGYAGLLLAMAVVSGVVAVWLRPRWPVRSIAAKLGFDTPNEDFIKAHLLRINAKNSDDNAVIVRLKSGAVFSGTSETMSRFNHGGPNYYYFSNLAWLTRKGKWEEREGGILIERGEIEYIETPYLG